MGMIKRTGSNKNHFIPNFFIIIPGVLYEELGDLVL